MAISPQASKDIQDAAFDALVTAFGAARARVALVVMFCESGFRAWRRNGSGAPYYGLNQMGRAELEVMGLTPLQWMSMPAEKQVPYVARFWLGKSARFGDWMWELPEHLYACNFLPARVAPGMARDRALTSKGERDWRDKAGVWHSYYESNQGLDLVAELLGPDGHGHYDVGQDGAIDLEDFAAWIRKRKAEEARRWGELEARLEEAIARTRTTQPEVIVTPSNPPVYAAPEPQPNDPLSREEA